MLKYQAPVLYLALAPDNSALIASTTDRALTIRRRDLRHAAAAAMAVREGAARGSAGGAEALGGGGPRRVRTGTVRYFSRGMSERIGVDDVKVGGGGGRRRERGTAIKSNKK